MLTSDTIGGVTAPRPEELIPSLRPGSLDNQTHLLAAMLGGSNTDPRNFAAMFRRANNPRMLTVEYAVRQAVRDKGQQVMYSAIPKYIGNSSRPIYIHIKAIGNGPNPLMINVKIWNIGH